MGMAMGMGMTVDATSHAANALATTSIDLASPATTAPVPTMKIVVDDARPIRFPLSPPDASSRSEQPSNPDRRFTGEQALRDGELVVRWDLTIDADPIDHATITGSILMANRTDVPIAFDAILSVPLSPLIDGPTTLGGRIGVTLENDGDGGRLDVPAGDALIRVLFDGDEVHRLHRGPFVMGGPSAGTTAADAQFGAPMPAMPAPRVRDHVGCRMRAAITSGDEVALQVRLVVAGDEQDFIRRRSTAPVRIEATPSRRIISVDGKRRPTKRGRTSGRSAGAISIAPTRP